MKPNILRKFYFGTVGDIKNLEAAFSEMAEKGWMIEKIGLFTHRYKAVEPCKPRFFVDLLPQITAFDYPENEDAQDYRAMCEASGWEFVTANKQLHVFCSGNENAEPIPLHTDNGIHARIYLNACLKYELLIYALVITSLLLLNLFESAEGILLSNTVLFNTLGYLIFLPSCLWSAGFSASYCLRLKKAAKNSLPLPLVNRRLANIRNGFSFAGFLWLFICEIAGIANNISGGATFAFGLLVLLPLLAFGVGIWLRHQIDTKKRTRKANRTLFIVSMIAVELCIGAMICFIVYLEVSAPKLDKSSLAGRPALTLKDVSAEPAAQFSRLRVDGTPAVPDDYTYSESNADGSVNTHVYRGINATVAQILYKDLSKEFKKNIDDMKESMGEYFKEEEYYAVLTSGEAAFWGAEQGLSVYRDYTDGSSIELLLANGNTILHISAQGKNFEQETLSKAVKELWT